MASRTAASARTNVDGTSFNVRTSFATGACIVPISLLMSSSRDGSPASAAICLTDIVLPGSLHEEDEGTVTQVEGRVIKINKAVDCPGEARQDWVILQDIARALGRTKGFTFASPREIFEELRVASKGGVAALTHTLGWEYIKRGVRVNAVAPGGIATPMTDAMGAGGFPEGADMSLFAHLSRPDGIYGSPENIASIIAMIASEDDAYMNAEVVRVDGGYHG